MGKEKIMCDSCGKVLNETDYKYIMEICSYDDDKEDCKAILCEKCSDEPDEFIEYIEEMKNRRARNISGTTDLRGFESDEDYMKWEKKQM